MSDAAKYLQRFLSRQKKEDLFEWAQVRVHRLDTSLGIMYKAGGVARRNDHASLDGARAALRAALEQRKQMDKKIANLKQKIVALARRCEENPAEAIGLELADQMGMTDSCRIVLEVAEKELSPVEVRDQLESIGLTSTRYGNLLASIHTTLKRIVARGEAEKVATPDRGTAYRWKARVVPRYRRRRQLLCRPRQS